jgi:hypothetical protein
MDVPLQPSYPLRQHDSNAVNTRVFARLSGSPAKLGPAMKDIENSIQHQSGHTELCGATIQE